MDAVMRRDEDNKGNVSVETMGLLDVKKEKAGTKKRTRRGSKIGKEEEKDKNGDLTSIIRITLHEHDASYR